MGRLSGNIRISRKEEVAPLPSITKKDKKNYFGFNKGCNFVSQQSSSEYTTTITQRPEVHGFDIRIKTSGVTLNNYIARVDNLKLPKNGKYFISFDCWCSENYNQTRFYVDLCDSPTNPYVDKGFSSEGSTKIHYSAFVDVTNYNLLEGFFDFNLTPSSPISTGTVYHIENLMITDSDEEVDFVRPIEDIIANTLNGIDRPPQMVRRRIAEKNVWYSNGKDLLNDETITYLDIVVPYGTKDIANANVYMCINSMSFNENPTDSVLASSSNWKRLPNRGVQYMDTLIANNIDSNNVAAQNIILKSGNTVNGALTGVPGSQASNSAVGGSGYYMWIGSSNANNAPFSVDVNGNVKLGGSASFNRNVVEMKNDFTISTSTKESIFHCLPSNNRNINVTINNGNYDNKEIEIVNAASVSETDPSARIIEINKNGGIKFIIKGHVVDYISLNGVGSLVKLRHVSSSNYGASTNYFIVMNPEAFTIDTSESAAFAKPIPFVGKVYDINITVKSKDWYFDHGHTIETFSNTEAEDNGIYVHTNLPQDIRSWNPETKDLLVGVPYEIVITKYNNDGTEVKYKYSSTSYGKSSSHSEFQLYADNVSSGEKQTLLVVDLNAFYYRPDNPFNGLFSKNNKVFIQRSPYPENPNAAIHNLMDANDTSNTGFLGTKLIIRTPSCLLYNNNESGRNPEYPIINFSGTLYVNK
nr:MAG TPA: hypothetical protein [Crassvirales sp.]